jgi:hypothetical protein
VRRRRARRRVVGAGARRGHAAPGRGGRRARRRPRRSPRRGRTTAPSEAGAAASVTDFAVWGRGGAAAAGAGPGAGARSRPRARSAAGRWRPARAAGRPGLDPRGARARRPAGAGRRVRRPDRDPVHHGGRAGRRGGRRRRDGDGGVERLRPLGATARSWRPPWPRARPRAVQTLGDGTLTSAVALAVGARGRRRGGLGRARLDGAGGRCAHPAAPSRRRPRFGDPPATVRAAPRIASDGRATLALLRHEARLLGGGVGLAQGTPGAGWSAPSPPPASRSPSSPRRSSSRSPLGALGLRHHGDGQRRGPHRRRRDADGVVPEAQGGEHPSADRRRWPRADRVAGGRRVRERAAPRSRRVPGSRPPRSSCTAAACGSPTGPPGRRPARCGRGSARSPGWTPPPSPSTRGCGPRGAPRLTAGHYRVTVRAVDRAGRHAAARAVTLRVVRAPRVKRAG